MGLLYHLEKARVKHGTRLRGGHRRCVRARTAAAADLQAFEALHSDELFFSTRHGIDTCALLWYVSPIKEIRTMKEMTILDVERRTTESRSGHI
jgi:hypothetical protein